MAFDHARRSEAPDAIAPDGSEIRRLVANRAGKLTVAKEVRRHRVDRAARFRRLEGEAEQPDHIRAMNPGKPLPAAAEWPARAEPEQSQHLRQRAAVPVQHHAEPEPRDSQT